ncbi:MAG: hypothetical protein AAGD32_03390 [Planctomycetota bacterium]
MGRRVHKPTDDRHRPRDEGPADRSRKRKRQVRDSGRSAWSELEANVRRESAPATMLMVGCDDSGKLDRPHRADGVFKDGAFTADLAKTGDEAIGRMRLGAVDLLVVGETDLPDQPLQGFVRKVTSAWPELAWAMWRSADEPTAIAADELWARRNGAAAVVDGDDGWGQLVELTERCSKVRRAARSVVPTSVVPKA